MRTADIVALILVIGSMVLLVLGIDGEVKSILLLAGGWAFGSGYQHIQNTAKK